MKRSEDDGPAPVFNRETILRSTGLSKTSPGKPSTRDILPELLLKEGQATAGQIREALKRQNEEGVFFGEVLVRQGVLAKNSLVSFLTSHCKIPYLDLLDYTVDRSVLQLIPAEICWNYHLLPLDKLGRNLTVAMVNPLNREALSAVSRLVPDLTVRPILCDHKQFELVAERFFGSRDGHDEFTWAYTPMVQEALPQSIARPASQQRAADEDQHVAATAYTLEATGDTSVGIRALLDREALIRALFAGDHQASVGHDPAVSHKAGPPDPVPAPEEISTIADMPFPEDQVVNEFNSVDGLVQQIADILFDSMHETYAFLARKMPIFRALPPGDVARLYSEDTIALYDEGVAIFRPGEPAEGFYLVLGGQVELLGEDGMHCVLNPGDLFGDEVFSGAAWRASRALAKTKTTVFEIRLSALKEELVQESAVQLLFNVISMLGQNTRICGTIEEA